MSTVASHKFPMSKVNAARPILREYQRHLLSHERDAIIFYLSTGDVMPLRTKLSANMFSHLLVLVAAYERVDLLNHFLKQGA
jgi:hypothetical protein